MVVIATFGLKWVDNLLYELGVQSSFIPLIYYDNIDVTCLSDNSVFHSQTKHFVVDFHFVHNLV